jgi:hypothetical protein
MSILDALVQASLDPASLRAKINAEKEAENFIKQEVEQKRKELYEKEQELREAWGNNKSRKLEYLLDNLYGVYSGVPITINEGSDGRYWVQVPAEEDPYIWRKGDGSTGERINNEHPRWLRMRKLKTGEIKLQFLRLVTEDEPKGAKNTLMGRREIKVVKNWRTPTFEKAMKLAVSYIIEGTLPKEAEVKGKKYEKSLTAKVPSNLELI